MQCRAVLLALQTHLFFSNEKSFLVHLIPSHLFKSFVYMKHDHPVLIKSRKLNLQFEWKIRFIYSFIWSGFLVAVESNAIGSKIRCSECTRQQFLGQMLFLHRLETSCDQWVTRLNSGNMCGMSVVKLNDRRLRQKEMNVLHLKMLESNQSYF